MSFPGLLDSKVNVARQTRTADGQGGYSSATDTVLLHNVPCRFESLAGREAAQYYQKLTPLPDFIVYMEFQSLIKEGDILIDDRARRYAVKMVEDWSLQKRYLKLAVSQIERL